MVNMYGLVQRPKKEWWTFDFLHLPINRPGMLYALEIFPCDGPHLCSQIWKTNPLLERDQLLFWYLHFKLTRSEVFVHITQINAIHCWGTGVMVQRRKKLGNSIYWMFLLIWPGTLSFQDLSMFCWNLRNILNWCSDVWRVSPFNFSFGNQCYKINMHTFVTIMSLWNFDQGCSVSIENQACQFSA